VLAPCLGRPAVGCGHNPFFKSGWFRHLRLHLLSGPDARKDVSGWSHKLMRTLSPTSGSSRKTIRLHDFQLAHTRITRVVMQAPHHSVKFNFQSVGAVRVLKMHEALVRTERLIPSHSHPPIDSIAHWRAILVLQIPPGPGIHNDSAMDKTCLSPKISSSSFSRKLNIRFHFRMLMPADKSIVTTENIKQCGFLSRNG